MPENNYNMINPVEGLNNLAAINPVDRRKERQKKQNPDEKKNKNRIFEEGVREDWFAFREKALKGIATDFLESQGITFIDE